MRIAIALVTVVGVLAPATSAVAAPATPTAATSAAKVVRPTLVARWSFDAGEVGGRIADTSGRKGAPALTVRQKDSGAIRYEPGTAGGKFAAFPVACASDDNCPRALLEAASTPDLNPGVRPFRWGASVRVLKSQVKGSSNIMQKGIAKAGGQWKMQIGATQARAQCAMTDGKSSVYIARSSTSIADGSWHKLFCARIGTTLNVFVDGFRRGSVTIPSTLSVSNEMPLRVGGPNFNTRSDMFHGYLDDVYVALG